MTTSIIILMVLVLAMIILLAALLGVRYELKKEVREVEQWVGPITGSGKTSLTAQVLKDHGFTVVEAKDGIHGMHPELRIIATLDVKQKDWIIEIRGATHKWMDRFTYLEDLVLFTARHGHELTPQSEAHE